MIMDERNEFVDNVALDTGGTGLANLGDVIDIFGGGPAPGGAPAAVMRDIGQGRTVYLVILVTDDVDSTGDGATVGFRLVSDAQDPIAVDGSETHHLETGHFAQAELVAGFRLIFALPIEGNVYERFLGVQQNVGVEAVTAGSISAFLTLDPAGNKAYPDALPDFAIDWP